MTLVFGLMCLALGTYILLQETKIMKLRSTVFAPQKARAEKEAMSKEET